MADSIESQETSIKQTEEPEGKIIMFKISSGLIDEDKESVLHNVGTLTGIFAVAAVHPDAVSEDLRNEHYAMVQNDADFDKVMDEMRKLSGTTSIWMPPQQ